MKRFKNKTRVLAAVLAVFLCIATLPLSFFSVFADEVSADKKIEYLNMEWKDAWYIFPYNGQPNALASSTCDTSSDNQFQYSVSLGLSGTGFHPENSIELRIPQHILFLKNGEPSDFIHIGVPARESVNESTQGELCYYLDSDSSEYVITNFKEVEGGYKAVIEVSYEIKYQWEQNKFADDITSFVPQGIVWSITEEQAVAGNVREVHASLCLKDVDNKIVDSKTSNSIYVQIDSATLFESSNSYGYIFHRWADEWGTQPEDCNDDEYFYAVYLTIASVSGYTGAYEQEFNLYCDITGNTFDGGEVIATKTAYKSNFDFPKENPYHYLDSYTDANGDPLSCEIGNVKIVDSDDSLKCNFINTLKVLVKYKKSDYAENQTLTYTATNHLIGIDDNIDQVEQSTVSLAYAQPSSVDIPIGNNCLYKYVDNNNSESLEAGYFGQVRSLLLNDMNAYISTGYGNKFDFYGGKYVLADGKSVDDTDLDDSDIAKTYTPYLTDDRLYVAPAVQTVQDSADVCRDTNQNADILKEEYRLNADDYSITSFTLFPPDNFFNIKNVAGNNDTVNYETLDGKTEIGGIGDIMVKFADGTTQNPDDLPWTKIGTFWSKYTWSKFVKVEFLEEYSSFCCAEGLFYNSVYIVVPDNYDIVGISLSYPNTDALIVSFNFCISGLELHPTSHLKNMILSNPDIDCFEIKNINTAYVVDCDGNIIDDYDTALYCDGILDSSLSFKNNGTLCENLYNNNPYTKALDDENYGGAVFHCYSSEFFRGSKNNTLDLQLYYYYKKNNTENKSHELNYDFTITKEESFGYDRVCSDDEFYEYVRKCIDSKILEPETEGTFYIYLPKGSYVSSKSAFEYNTRKMTLDYEIIDNWRQTGQSMLIVHCERIYESPEDIYSRIMPEEDGRYYSQYSLFKNIFSFSLVLNYPWDAVTDFGKYAPLCCLYETPYRDRTVEGITIPAVTNALTDSQEDMQCVYTSSAVPCPWFVDINNDGTYEHRYALERRSVGVSANTNTTLSLSKSVKGNNNMSFGTGSNNSQCVQFDEHYYYQIRIGSEKGKNTKDLILYDSLENYMPVSNENGTEEGYELAQAGVRWRGTFSSIDLSQPEGKGIAPVVYYSETENLDIENNSDVSDSSVWKVLTDDTDKTKVKALAIDLSKNTDGNDYVLDEEQTVNVRIEMTAPSSFPVINGEMRKDAHTYNNVFAQAGIFTKGDDGSTAINELIHQNYTQLLLKASKALVSINKINNFNKPVQGAALQILDSDGNIAQEWLSDGSVAVFILPYGSYTLHEETAPQGFEKAADIPFEVVQNEDSGEDELYIDGVLLDSLTVTMVDRYNVPSTGIVLSVTPFALLAAGGVYLSFRKKKKSEF